MNERKHFIQVTKLKLMPKALNLNYRSVLAMCEIEKLHTALSTFCGYINIPESLKKNFFQIYSIKTLLLLLYRDS